MSKGNGSAGCVAAIGIAIGLPIYFMATNPLLFFLVILPVTVLLIIAFIRWLKK